MIRLRHALLGTIPALFLLYGPHSVTQSQDRPPGPTLPPPRLVPLAETKLVMEGIAKSNYDGLTKILQQKPGDAETWNFARGQSLLIGESANLLLIRPPKTRAAQEIWVPRAVEMRDTSVKLAKAASERDYLSARAALAELTNSCNRCHESFKVPLRMSPIEMPE